MIALGGTSKARESCDRQARMIALGGTSKAREPTDQAPVAKTGGASG